MAQKHTKKENLEKLSEDLAYNPRLVWDSITSNEKKKVFKFADAYKTFLGNAKTEREAVTYIKKIAIERGFHEEVKHDNHAGDDDRREGEMPGRKGHTQKERPESRDRSAA